CSMGTMIPTIMLASRKASGQGGLLYLQYIFRYNHVTGITWSGGSGGGGQGTKTLSLQSMGGPHNAPLAGGKEGRNQAWAWNTAAQSSKAGSSSLEIPGVPKAPNYVPSHV